MLIKKKGLRFQLFITIIYIFNRNATNVNISPSYRKEFIKKYIHPMKQFANLVFEKAKFSIFKINPNIVLLFLVIAFFLLLIATENVVKLTLLP